MKERRHRQNKRVQAVFGVALLVTACGGSTSQEGEGNAIARACQVTYATTNKWEGGFLVNVAITNQGAPIDQWDLAFDFPGAQALASAWKARSVQSGVHVVMSNEEVNAHLATGQSALVGFFARGAVASPASFSLNGVACKSVSD